MRTDVIYVEAETVYFSPDGIGRIYFEDLKEAKDETGINRIVVVVTH